MADLNTPSAAQSTEVLNTITKDQEIERLRAEIAQLQASKLQAAQHTSVPSDSDVLGPTNVPMDANLMALDLSWGD